MSPRPALVADTGASDAADWAFGRLADNVPCVLVQLQWQPCQPAPTFPFVGGSCHDILDIDAAALMLDGSLLMERVQPEEATALRDDIRRAFAARTCWQSRFRMRVKDKLCWIEWHGRVSMQGDTPTGYGYLTDVTEQLGTHFEAQGRSRIWAAILEQSAEGVMICDAQRRIVMVNAAFERLTGYTSKDAIGQTPCFLHSGRQDQLFYTNMWRSILHSGQWSGEIWNRRRNGEEFVEWLSIRAVYDERARVTQYVGIFSDITQRKAAEARALYLTDFDSLTELPNRTLLTRRLSQLAEITARNGGRLGVLYVDLDRFNNVNASMGPETGDLLLQIMARRIEAAVRIGDTVARMGADEFAVLLPELREASDAASVAQKILDTIGAPVVLRGQSLAVSASIGICVFPDDGSVAEDLIVNAVAAMSQAKRGQRNTYKFYTTQMNAQAAVKLRIENELRLAVERNELVLHYQPQVDLASGAIVGAEALVRWNRPGIGLVMPGEFIPVAQERGLILLIGRWVLQQAVRQIRAWNERGLPPITLAVNLTATEFHQPGFVSNLEQAVRQHGIPPARLELELTESIAVQDLDGTARILSQLHSLGIRLSLDDFGTGYSSLSYLQHFPIDKIKIDQSFVRELIDKPQATRVVRAIIGLARSFATRVIAEGVETAAQLTALQAEHCDEIQGHLVAPALPVRQFEQLLRDWKPWTESCVQSADRAPVCRAIGSIASVHCPTPQQGESPP